ncbi:prepilin-type N-terminal cleavage/methylation domain-containing protein [Pleurocapsales cyanobacterium LEGE 06147]|nr:prepilin-type N-terminal cleavage/methylation domain-containing protein [Pleurocapsales cyanobacterium LEGE 06147]
MQRLIIKNIVESNQDNGFTLIELLIVILIIGTLSAISLPNLLSQVGKAREAEAKNILGALNRAQQSYFSERAVFADNGQIDKLEVPLGGVKYYTFDVVALGVQKATGNNNANNGTRDYLGGVQYATNTRAYRSILCRSTKSASRYDIAATDVINAGVNVSANVIACNNANSEEIK